MATQQLSALLAGLAEPSAEAEVRHLTIDPAEVVPGTLFCARSAWWGDTHERLEEVVERGATAILTGRPMRLPLPHAWAPEDPTLGLVSERFYDRPCAKLKVYGVTGTNGKTSTAWLLLHLLRAAGERPALMSTIEYRFEERRVAASNTTPDALVIHRFAAQARSLGATALVLEVSSHALAIGRVAGLAFDAVGFTNLSHEHLDFHGDEANYLEAKGRLFGECLKASIERGKRPVAVAPDSPHGRAMLARVPPGVACRAPAVLSLEAMDLEGLRGRCGEAPYSLPMIGRHNLENAALALAMVEATHGAAPLAALTDFPGVPGRLQRATPEVFVDYAHTPDAVERAIATLREATAEPLTVVLGCGGDRDRAKRPLMARAARSADHVILTSDNPRSEDPRAILAAMAPGAPGAERIEDRAAAIERAMARPGVALILGKGHERSQEAMGRRRRFDDVEVARALAGGRAPETPELPTPRPHIPSLLPLESSRKL